MPDETRPGPDPGPPFITRRSLLGFSALATAAFIAYGQLYDASDAGGGRLGVAAAGAFGVAMVVGAVAWVGGIRLAGRSGSLLWLCVVAFTPVVGSLAYSLWGPARTRPPAPPPSGLRR
jgi:hypothetical protein